MQKLLRYMFIHCAGYLDQSSDDDTLQPGTKLELPFWLARSLCSRRRHIVSVELPRTYREGYRQVFKADPNVVDLHKLGPYFYGFGSHLLSFQHPESADVANTLVQVRYVFFFCWFSSGGGGCCEGIYFIIYCNGCIWQNPLHSDQGL